VRARWLLWCNPDSAAWRNTGRVASSYRDPNCLAGGRYEFADRFADAASDKPTDEATDADADAVGDGQPDLGADRYSDLDCCPDGYPDLCAVRDSRADSLPESHGDACAHGDAKGHRDPQSDGNSDGFSRRHTDARTDERLRWTARRTSSAGQAGPERSAGYELRHVGVGPPTSDRISG
jgi:hypothetical protein